MDIRFIKDSELDEGLRKLIKSLPESKVLREKIKGLRNKLHIPQNGFSDKRFVEGAKFYEKNKKEINEAVNLLLREFKSPQNWKKGLKNLLLFDFALLYDQEIVLETPLEKYLNEYQEPPYLKIAIFGNISRNQLDKWLDKHWLEIKKYFKKLGFKKLKRIKRKWHLIALEGMKMLNKGKLWEEIQDTLDEKYGDDKDSHDFISDKTLFRQTIKRINDDLGKPIKSS